MTGATPAQLAAYLARIGSRERGFAEELRADLSTLTMLHRAHVESIAWECVDCFLGRPTGRDPRAAFDKIVVGGRGGWCYEMNGLFGWMLEAIGFSVTRLAAGVMREHLGDDAIGNHLLLIVHLDRDYLADVGLGSGLIEPIPFIEGDYPQRHATFGLRKIEGDWWRFHNQPGVAPPSFDFSPQVRDEALLDARCRWLQSDPGSPFRQNAVIQRYGADGLDSLVGPVLTRTGAEGAERHEIADEAEYAAALRDRFGLDPADAAAIWARFG